VKKQGSGARASMAVNGLGALATGVTVVVMAVVKFMAGAWVGGAAGAVADRRDARGPPSLSKNRPEIAAPGNLKLENLQEPIVIVPIIEWSTVAENALRLAMTLSREVEVLHIESEDSTNSLSGLGRRAWKAPAREAKQAIRG